MEVYVDELLAYLPVSLVVLFTAAMPFIELKGAIPIGIVLGLSPFLSSTLSYIGSTMPAPFILFGLRPFLAYLKKMPVFEKFTRWITERSLSKSGKVQKYGVYGLFILVAVPLPGTGVWTGSIIAALLNIRFKRAFTAIVLGNLVTCLIIMSLLGLYDTITLFG